MHVGLPCMKLSLSPSTQKHNGKKAGTCSVKAAWDEMRDVRRGRDETIDRSMTDQNVWLCGSTDMDLEAEIQKYIDQVNVDKKAHGKRVLRCDAVTGIEMIEKPPMEYMEKLSREEQIRFLRASSDVMDQILKDWKPDWITVAQVIHFDEFGGKAPHTHRIVVPLTKDKNGVLAFNAKAEFNLKFFTFVNTEYPKRMRERGYEVEDCKIYDRMTAEEKKQHRQNKPEYGLEGFEYKRRKQQELETAIGEKEAVVEDLEDRQRELADQNKILEERNRQVKIRIMTEEEVKALPKPQKTLGGDYKISPKKYQNLLATAKRVDLAEHNQRVLRDKEQRLQEKEADLEKKQRLPIPERIELSALRKMKTIVEKIVSYLPDGLVRDALLLALEGRDLIEEKNRQRGRTRNIGHELRRGIYPKDCVNLCTDVRYTYQYGGFFMARRKSDSPQKAALREMMSNYMRDNDVHIKDGTDVNSLMRDMMSVILEGTLDAEMDEELGYSKYDYKNKDTENSRNGYSQKTMHTSYGDMEIDVPRDRKGEFEPQVVKKYQNTVTQDMEEKIISMYAKGMTTADIESHMRDLYDIEISDSTISRITDKILPIVKEWQERPLEEVYAVVFMDAIHYHVRSEGRIVKRAVYIAIGIDMSGKKDVLGMYVGENESAKFWLSIMNSLKNRGVEEILIACVDGLTGFPQAIEAVYPHAEIQQCIIHQIRNSTKYVSYKDLKKLMLDLKKVYAAPDEQTALANLEEFGEKWNTKYPKISKSWSEHWPSLATYFKYPESVRRLIYTTNTIEGFNRQLRKVTKSKTIFPSDDSLLKMLYLAMIDITKKWTGHRQDWGEIHSQLEIYFEERLEGHRY